jgi:hypothetical protein
MKQYKTCPQNVASIYRGSSSWTMMNYIVCEPGEWSVMRIVHDMGGGSRALRIYKRSLKRLRDRGLVVIGEQSDSTEGPLTTGQLKQRLKPTVRGIEAFKNVGSVR